MEGPANELEKPLETTRRRFYVGGMYALWALIMGALGGTGLAYLFLPPERRRGEQWVEAADVAKLGSNAPVEVMFRRTRVDGWRVLSEKGTAWVVKSTDGAITAFGPQCTHLGCAYHWDAANTEFICPCHSSIFSIQGDVKAGPAPRALDRYETKVEGGKLLLGSLRSSEVKEA
jgi:menaquinol-cytochrome c reductase iron-sulfur subunit